MARGGEMKSILYRLWYGYEMSQAYIAGMIGDTACMTNHLSMADRVYLMWWKEQQ